MKKTHFLKVTILFLMIIFVSCEIPSNPVSVALIDDGELIGKVNLDKFNDAIVPELDENNLKDGYKFLGWSLEENQEEPLISNGGVVTYQMLYPYLDKDSINLYSVYVERSEEDMADLVVGWYAKTETSGLSDEIVKKLEKPLIEYLKSKGYETDSLTIEFRSYDGDVATMGSNVNSDGDVDILIGVGGNITSKGNVETIEMASDIPMGGKSRTNVRLSDTDLSKDAFIFLNSTDATNLLN